jgi:hypothetical protein
MAERDVNYRSKVFESLPPGEEKTEWSPYVEKLAEIVADTHKHAPRWILIGDYGNKDSAKGAVGQLRRRHGSDESIEGWRFEHRPVQVSVDGQPQKRQGVFAQYDGTKIVPGLAEKNKAEWREYRTRQQEQKKAKMKEKAGAAA